MRSAPIQDRIDRYTPGRRYIWAKVVEDAYEDWRQGLLTRLLEEEIAARARIATLHSEPEPPPVETDEFGPITSKTKRIQ